MFCQTCGKKVNTENNFCVYCGERLLNLSNNQYIPEQKINPYISPSGNIIIIFAILGIMGIISCGFLSFFSIPALIMTLKEIKKYPLDERLKTAKVLSIIGIILLIISIISIAIFLSIYLKDIIKTMPKNRFYN